MNSIRIWVGDWGQYIIPAELLHIKVTKTGWPDKRSPKNAALMLAWVEEQEKKMREMPGDDS